MECDAVVHLRNGQYGLIEIKLEGDSLIKEGAETLNALAEQIDTTRMKSPALKMILTATGEYAYRRPEDGIYVIPIGCLKPWNLHHHNVMKTNRRQIKTYRQDGNLISERKCSANTTNALKRAT